MADGPNGRTALVLYGTETGNSQDIAYELDQTLRRLHFETDVREIDDTTLTDIRAQSLVLIAISTTGQGDFPSTARKFWTSLLRKKLSSDTLDRVSYGLVGLCDSSYPRFNLSARKLHKRLKQLGARPLIDPCEADEQAEDGTEGCFLVWLPFLTQALLEQYPLSDGLAVIEPSQKLESPLILSPAGQYDKSAKDGRSTHEANGHEFPTFGVVVEANERVTPASHWQDVRHIRLRASLPVKYLPGDALAIKPENSVEDVNRILQILGWTEQADQEVLIIRNPEFEKVGPQKSSHPQKVRRTTLRHLLIYDLDINAIPRRSFFSKISHYTHDEMQKERASEFADAQYLDEYFDYATRPRRSILEVLQEFHTVRIPWQEAINIFPAIRPRQFSIASGGTISEDGHVFELLVAIVRYRTVIKRIREGLCTKYLARLSPGENLKVTLCTEGRFHQNVAELRQSHLLIAAGTGIAPIRSLLLEKKLAGYGRSTLIFGCRNSQADFFFQSDWQALSDGLTVITAFSRDQSEKVYVQDRINEHADRIAAMVVEEDAQIVVCGSSGPMPKAVRQVLKDALCSTGVVSDEDEAEIYLVRLEKMGRYKQETW